MRLLLEIALTHIMGRGRQTIVSIAGVSEGSFRPTLCSKPGWMNSTTPRTMISNRRIRRVANMGKFRVISNGLHFITGRGSVCMR